MLMAVTKNGILPVSSKNTDQLPHSPLTAPKAPLLSQLISPLVMGFSKCQNLSSLSPPSLPTKDKGPIPLILLFLFPISFFYLSLSSYGDLSCTFRWPRPSASVQSELCENCSICRCVLDTFVERDKLHVSTVLTSLQ